MLHIVSFSSGLSSALTAVRVMERYGKGTTRLVFMDTLFEDDDNYRFMAEFEKRFDVQIIRITAGRDPYQVSRAQHVIPNNSLAPCTFRLKIEPFRAYLAGLSKPVTVHIGYDWSEVHRCEPTRKNYEGFGYGVDFPLLWPPVEWRPYERVSREEWGIEPPRMYALGYTHANCGGRCVKQGQGDWIRTFINFPERYRAIEEWEHDMRKNPTNANYAICKRETNGVRRPLTLQQLREEYEAGQTGSLFDLDAASTCVVCGIGGQ